MKIGRSPWTLRTLFIASVVGPLVIAGLMAWQQHRNAEREAYSHVHHTLGLLHEHAQRVFEIYDLVLDRVADRIEGLSWGQIRAREPALHQELGQITSGVEQVGSLFLVDPTGHLAVSAMAMPSPRLDTNDRSYFRTHVAQDAGTYVDHAVLSRISGRVIFNVSKRRPSVDGEFDGVIALASEQDYWLRFYSTLDQRLSPSVNLVRAEGDTLIRFPAVPFGQARPSEQFMQLIQARSEAYYEVTSRADGSVRIVGYRKLARYPVYVVYTVSKDAVLAGWRNEAAIIVLFTVAAIGLLSTITFFLRQRMHSEWRLQSALSEANRTLEANVARRTSELLRALREKEVLLREVHHRVKNNLQMTASMVRIVRRSAPPASQPLLDDVTRRIIAVGQVYDQIHKADDLSHLELATYLQSVCDQLIHAFGRKGVTVRTQLQPVMVDIDTALPVGLIAQELATNAFKHGLSVNGTGQISIKLKRTDQTGVLTIRDDGTGLCSEPAPGTGLRLVERLAEQIGGTVRAKSRPDGGAQFRLTFPLKKGRSEVAETPQP
jgi:two-component system, NtrC family, sensor kinase